MHHRFWSAKFVESNSTLRLEKALLEVADIPVQDITRTRLPAFTAVSKIAPIAPNFPQLNIR